jgi:predicted dehydrogenase
MKSESIPRRHFLKTTAGAAGLLLASSVLGQEVVDTSTKPPIIKVGLVGCGGRGLGAIRNALDADPQTVVWALADAFQERIDAGTKLISEQYGDRMQATPDRRFVGLDAFRHLLATDIDVVLLCTPPAFRPQHVVAALAAGKHMYVEKPVAVDVPGALLVLEAARQAASRPLVIADGFCWRYDRANREARQRLEQGTLGKVLAFDGVYYTTPPKSPLALDARPLHESDVSWALRNWTAWNWLSGGQFVEQIVHTIDGMMWSMGDEIPIAAVGSGGRAQRTDDGDVWDHYEVRYDFGHDVYGHISCRQWVGCHGEVADRTVCEKGVLMTPYRPHIQAAERWRFRGEDNDMYAQTHVDFYRHLRNKEWVQTLEKAAIKTLVAIMGRKAAHSGQRVTWDDIMSDTESLMPEGLTMDSRLPVPEIPIPGKM